MQHAPACGGRAVTANHRRAGSELTGVEIDEAWVLLTVVAVGSRATEKNIITIVIRHRSTAAGRVCLREEFPSPATIGPAATTSRPDPNIWPLLGPYQDGRRQTSLKVVIE